MFELSKFNEYREDNRREVKKARKGLPDSLWSTYSAFANCYGGVIILGVEENADGSWSTTGLQGEGKLQKDFWNNINNPQKVSHNLLTEQDVRTYQLGEDTMDMKVLDNMQLDVLNMETVHAYRNRHMAYRSEHVWEQLKDADYLERIGAAKLDRTDGNLHPTAAGLLMFGDEYKILYEYPEYFLDFRELLDPEIRWTDRLQSSSGDWTGNLFDFFFRVYGKLVKDIKIPFRLDGVVRVDDTHVHKAIREALANCIVNTDFYLPRGIVIKKD